MTHTVSQRILAYFGWCPNSPGAHIRAIDHTTGKVPPNIAKPEPPQPSTIPAQITVPSWMTAAALGILFATCFVGGNIWWPFFVGVVLLAFLIYWYYCQGKEVR